MSFDNINAIEQKIDINVNIINFYKIADNNRFSVKIPAYVLVYLPYPGYEPY